MLEIEAAASDREARRALTAKWVKALADAEAAAAALPEAERRHFHVNYRIADAASETKGTGDARRAALVEMICSLAPAERHESTSTWLVALHIRRARAIDRLLSAPLDLALDGLHVTRVSPTNRASFGVTGLQG